ncbi:MAG: glycosyltransferase [Pseudomonadales bacterium]
MRTNCEANEIDYQPSIDSRKFVYRVKLSVSIVTFESDRTLLAATFQSLLKSVTRAREALPALHAQLYVIENEVHHRRCLQQVQQLLQSAQSDVFADVKLSTSESNVGFGGGHNHAINALDSDIHLILNPDVELADDAILNALEFFESAPEVGLLSPRAVDANNSYLYLCKRYPAVFDLFVRGFVPQRWHHLFKERLSRYEMRELNVPQASVAAIEIVSGCCMFVRTPLLQAVGGFNDKYFLYFEDFDLSLRIGQLAGLAYVPSVNIIHYGGDAARKGWRHILLFARSALRFFQDHGWRWV